MTTIKPSTIADINGLPNKALIYRFIGTVVSCYERKSGTNAKGEWSIQNAILRDASGESIKLMLNGLPEQTWPDGAAIELGTWEGPKGHSGLYAEDDTYNNETKRIMRATKTCAINSAMPQEAAENGQGYPEQDGAPQHQQQAPDHDTRNLDNMPDQAWGDEPSAADQQQATAQPPAPQQAPAQHQAPPKKKTATSDFKQARKTIVQIANLHLTCAIAAQRMEAPTYCAATGHEMTPEQLQSATASIFIKAERSGLVNDMPTSPLNADDFSH
tara:strand:- start:43358 stop:44173 length:816 start_codon:yes stop_codon:yes gene_type:complete